jgi:hypothetical protein
LGLWRRAGNGIESSRECGGSISDAQHVSPFPFSSHFSMNNRITVFTDGQEVVLSATRSGFAQLSTICSRLASLTNAELATHANHFHFMANMNNATIDSLPLVLQATPDDESFAINSDC